MAEPDVHPPEDADANRSRLPRRTKAETSSAEKACPLCGKLINARFIERHADRCAARLFNDAPAGSDEPTRRKRRSAGASTGRRKPGAAGKRKYTRRVQLVHPEAPPTDLPIAHSLFLTDDNTNVDNANAPAPSTTTPLEDNARPQQHTRSPFWDTTAKTEQNRMRGLPLIKCQAIPAALQPFVRRVEHKLKQLSPSAIVVANSRGTIDEDRSAEIQHRPRADDSEEKNEATGVAGADVTEFDLTTRTDDDVRRSFVPETKPVPPRLPRLVMNVRITVDGQITCEKVDDEEFLRDAEKTALVATPQIKFGAPRPRRPKGANGVSAATLALLEDGDADPSASSPEMDGTTGDVAAMSPMVQVLQRMTSSGEPLRQQHEPKKRKSGASRADAGLVDGPSVSSDAKRPRTKTSSGVVVPVVFSSSSSEASVDAPPLDDGLSRDVTQRKLQSQPVVVNIATRKMMASSGRSSPSASSRVATSDEEPKVATMEDAQDYVRRMRDTHKLKPATISTFVGLLKDYKSSKISAESVMKQMNALLDGYPDLIEDFAMFLPRSIASTYEPPAVPAQPPSSPPQQKQQRQRRAPQSSQQQQQQQQARRSQRQRSESSQEVLEYGTPRGSPSSGGSPRASLAHPGKQRRMGTAERLVVDPRTLAYAEDPYSAAAVPQRVQYWDSHRTAPWTMAAATSPRAEAGWVPSSSAAYVHGSPRRRFDVQRHQQQQMLQRLGRPAAMFPPQQPRRHEPVIVLPARAAAAPTPIYTTGAAMYPPVVPPQQEPSPRPRKRGRPRQVSQDLLQRPARIETGYDEESPRLYNRRLNNVWQRPPSYELREDQDTRAPTPTSTSSDRIDGYDESPKNSDIYEPRVDMSSLLDRIQARFKDDPYTFETFAHLFRTAHQKLNAVTGPSHLRDVTATLLELFRNLDTLFNGKADDLIDALIDAHPSRDRIRELRRDALHQHNHHMADLTPIA